MKISNLTIVSIVSLEDIIPMLTYSFTNIGSDSLYHHLYQCIREDILCGNLTAETKLPSKRSFAKNLGVSNITVENAYAQLQAEGYIYSIPKKGFYVRNLSDLTLSISQTTSSTSNSLRMPDKYKVDLASNQMNPCLLYTSPSPRDTR